MVVSRKSRAGSRPLDLVPVQSKCHPFGAALSTADPDIIQRQERQIVQSRLTLYDFLPRITRPRFHFAPYRRSGRVGHRDDFTLLRIDPEPVDIDAVVLVPVFPSTDMDPGH